MAQAPKTPQMQSNFSNEPSMTYSVSNTKMMAEIEEKRHENLVLERRKSEAEVAQSEQSEIFGILRESLAQQALTVIVFGASGHLAKTKTYPALYDLFCEGIFPENVHIVGSVHIYVYPMECNGSGCPLNYIDCVSECMPYSVHPQLCPFQAEEEGL